MTPLNFVCRRRRLRPVAGRELCAPKQYCAQAIGTPGVGARIFAHRRNTDGIVVLAMLCDRSHDRRMHMHDALASAHAAKAPFKAAPAARRKKLCIGCSFGALERVSFGPKRANQCSTDSQRRPPLAALGACTMPCLPGSPVMIWRRTRKPTPLTVCGLALLLDAFVSWLG